MGVDLFEATDDRARMETDAFCNFHQVLYGIRVVCLATLNRKVNQHRTHLL